MANEFKVKHGLIVNGSGSTVLDVQGSQGQLFSITDSLSGSLFSVGDISGIPILEVFSDDTVKIGSYNNEAIVVSGSHATVSGSFSGSFVGDGSGLTGISVTTPTLQQVTDQGATTTNNITITGSLNITGSIAQAADTDVNNIFGRVRLGSYVTDYAYFSHYDHGSNSSYALRQAPNGSTQINSATGQGISFNVNNNGKAFLDSSGMFGIGTTSPESTLHVKSPSSFTSTGSLQIDTTAVSSTQVFMDLKGGTSGDQYIFRHYRSSTLQNWARDDQGRLQFYTKPTSAYLGSTAISFYADTTVTGNIASFGTLSNTYMIVSSSGNVGIGTTSPAAKLEVSGNTVLGGRVDIQQDIRLRGTDTLSNQGVVRFFVDSSDKLFIDTGNDGSNRFVIDSSGSAGIGTTSPAAKLDVIHTDASKETLRLGRSDNSSYWRVNHAGNDFRLYNTDASGADILFGVDAGGGTENNKVGIRTASPSYNLDVSGSGNFTDSLDVTGSISVVGGGGNTLLDLENSNGVVANINSSAGDSFFRFQDAGVTKWFIGRDNTNQNFTFSSGSGLGDGDLLTLTTSGEVGVNTSSPAGVFEVQTVDSNRYIRFKAPNGEERFELYTGGTGNPADLYMYDQDGTTKSIALRGGTSNSHLIGGNFGIGTSAPSEKLHVDGNVTASAFYGDGTNLTNVQRVPKVEYLSLTASIASNDVETLPNSLSYTTSSDGYEYLEVFLDGIRLNRTFEYSEVNTTQVRYLLNIPSGSMITYKSLTLV